MTGEITDIIRYKDGRIETRKGHNLVVNSMTNLVMALFKQQSGYKGIQYWAVGSGAESWDTKDVSPVVTENRLTKEIGRKAIPASAITFLDSNLEVTSTPTNMIQVVLTFEENDCNGTWREFGIFGGNATASANTGILINKKHHSVLTKTSDMIVERHMRFTINLA